jgi:site-specific recombinase XerD
LLPDNIWRHAGAPNVCLRKLVDEFVLFLKGRSKPASPQTITKYKQSLDLLLASIEAAGDPLVLESLTPAAGDRWIAQQRQPQEKRGRLSEDTIASRQYAVKTFSNNYVCAHLELTHFDQLRRWKRLRPEVKVKERLSADEIGSLLDGTENHPNPYIGTRNRAIVMVLLSTGIRLGACHKMGKDDVDPVSGEFTVSEKGGKSHKVRLSPAAQKAVRRWLRERRAKDTEAMWTTVEGHPITYYGLQIVFWRLKKESGVGRVHAHLCRHTYGQHAIEQGAERALVQDFLGHSSDVMTKRYTKTARERDAAKQMPAFSPV